MTKELPATSRVSGLGYKGFTSLISTDGLRVSFGPFNAHIQTAMVRLHEPLYSLYADYPVLGEDTVFSFRASIESTRQLRRLHRPLVRLLIDGRMPHEEMPAKQGLAVLEWGMNLVIAMRSHCFLMLHAAVLEKNGLAILLPAAPGYGKSTLCAALAHRGWRLLSDEFGLVRPGSTDFVPVPRPIALKNESIEVFREFVPDAFVGPPILNTRKGTVAHVKPPTDSIIRQSETAAARWIVFPRWQKDAGLTFESLSKPEGFMMVAMNAFNYELLGEAGFKTVSDIVSNSGCYRLLYSDLDEAIHCLDQLSDRNAPD